MKPPVKEVLSFVPRCIFNETDLAVARNYFRRWLGGIGPHIQCSDYVVIKFRLPNIDYPFSMNFCKLCYFTEIINDFEMKEIYCLKFAHIHSRDILHCANCGKSFTIANCIDDVPISEEQDNIGLNLIIVAAEANPFVPDREEGSLTHYLDVTKDSIIYDL